MLEKIQHHVSYKISINNSKYQWLNGESVSFLITIFQNYNHISKRIIKKCFRESIWLIIKANTKFGFWTIINLQLESRWKQNSKIKILNYQTTLKQNKRNNNLAKCKDSVKSFFYCSIFMIKLPILFSICPRLLREGVFFFWGCRNSNYLLLYTFWASLFKSLIHLITSYFFLFIWIIFLSTNFYFLETTLSSFHFLTWEYQGFFMQFLH